ncbi:hypothetical protein BDW67DRAFT_66929 [Aspergillus spinulosporus]
MADHLPRPNAVADPIGSVPRPDSQSTHTDTSASVSPRPRTPRNEANLDPDNLELHEIETQEDDDSGVSISSGEYRITTRRTVSRTSTSQTQRPRREGLLGRIQRFWTRNVVLTVAQKKNRDYFALERTFLAYIRTSVVLAMQGVLIAQLFRLQFAGSSKGLGYHEVGIPLSVTCHCAAIVTAILGAHRFWKQQSAIALGTVYAGGWELNCIGFLTTAVSRSRLISRWRRNGERN